MSKKFVERLKVACFAILIILLLYVTKFETLKNYRRTIALPKPAAITEQLETYYIGNYAFDMPISWKTSGVSATFYLENRKNGPTISLTEHIAPVGGEAARDPRHILDSDEKIGKLMDKNFMVIEKEDLTAVLGRPAGILVSSVTPEDVSKSYLAPLIMSLYLIEPQVVLSFRYMEKDFIWPADEEKIAIIGAKRKIFTDWALGFLTRYEWIGNNSPTRNDFLATRYGRIAIGPDLPELLYKLTAEFKPEVPSINQKFSFLSIKLSSFSELKPSYEKHNRTVGGHSGEEEKTITDVTRGFEKLKIWKPAIAFMDLTWQDLSNQAPKGPSGWNDLSNTNSSDPVNQYNPEISINYIGNSQTKGYPELAQVLGVWDILLNSVRLASENN